MEIDRRRFTLAAAAALAAPTRAAAGSGTPWSGRKIVDCHHHMRATTARNLAHLLGSGVSHALPIGLADGGPASGPEAMGERMRELRREQPRRFPAWLCSVDSSAPDAVARLTAAVTAGARGFGEMKSKVALDGPEMRRIYAAAADLDVPVLIHFDESHATGFDRVEAILKAFPRTRFVGHATAFWANIDADYDGATSYPRGRVRPGGLTDRLLSDYGNFFGDLSAGSGHNALTRDPDFTPAFLDRQKEKLIFGSDCFCEDGKGAGNRNGNCQARETLALLWANGTSAAFHKMTWANARGIYRW
jgi:predicted TIM-barrel fold metal-dependent hydrolase